MNIMRSVRSSKVTDPRGQASGKATYRYYDAAGRLVTVRDTEDYVTQTTYNGFGEILGVTRFYNKTASAVKHDHAGRRRKCRERCCYLDILR